MFYQLFDKYMSDKKRYLDLVNQIRSLERSLLELSQYADASTKAKIEALLDSLP